MRPHPYLRAYMAGIVVPTFVLVIVVTVFTILRYGVGVDLPLERILIFPLAIVPSLWGVWNMLYLALRTRLRMGIGVHGALLPFILVPAGAVLAHALDLFEAFKTAALFAPIGVAAYYLLWKHAVGFLNAEIGIA